MPETEGAGGEGGHRQGADGGVHEVRQQFEPQLHQGGQGGVDVQGVRLFASSSPNALQRVLQLTHHDALLALLKSSRGRDGWTKIQRGPLPEKILEWFKWDQSIFNAIRGVTYHATLLQQNPFGT